MAEQIKDGQIVEGWFLSPKERVIFKAHSEGGDGQMVLDSTEPPQFSVRVNEEVLLLGGLVAKNLRVLAVIPDLDDLTGAEEGDKV